MSVLKGAAGTPEADARRRVVGLVALLITAALAVTGLAGLSAAPAAAAGRSRAPIRVLAPRAGTVIVARNRAGAKRLRVGATLMITRPVGGLSAQLNGHPVRLPAVRSGRLAVRLGPANGLAVGENVLQVSAGRNGGRPRWVVPVRFFVGYRDRRVLSVRLRQAVGKKLPAAAAALRVPKSGVRSLIVTLNGTRVQVPEGARLLDLARSGALRRGFNRLRVQLLMTDGRVAELARTFQLGRLRNVAVARLRGRAAVGRTMVLDGGRSLTLPGQRRAGRFRWVLLHRPRLSHARLRRTRGARTTLRADVPGHYLIALVVGRGSQRGYDALSVSATYPEPLVPVDTIVYHGSTPGIQVGSTFYGLNETGCEGSSAIQVIFLRRDDLGFDGCSGSGTTTDSLNGLADVLKIPPSTNADFVIITHPGSKETLPFPAGSLPALDNVLRQIGGTLPAKWTFPNGTCWSGETGNCFVPDQGSQLASWQQGDFDGGSFSVIGVSGLTVGQAWRETAAQTHTQDGSIVGYFTQGVPTQTGAIGDYTVVNGGPTQYAPVNTCSGSSCDVSVGVNVTATTSAGSAEITSASPDTGYADGATIGGPGIPSGATIVSGAGTGTLTISSPATASATAVGLTVNQSYPSGANGLHVVALDRTTLAPILNQTVTNTTDLHTALTTPGPNTVGHFLPSGMDDQRLVIIQSVGNGEVTGTATTSLLQELDELGGTPELLPGTLSGQKYALVGAATNLPWRNSSALESSTAVPAIPGMSQSQAGQISGTVERDRDGLYAPSSGDPISPTNTDLPGILYQPAQPWPYAQDTTELNYIADNIGLEAYSDVRSAYVDETLASSWPNERQQLTDLTCTDPSQCGSQFAAVKSELLTEFAWIPKIYALGTNLLTPFESCGGCDYFDVAGVTQQVNASVPVSSTSNVSMKWLTIVADVMDVASGVAAVAGLPASNEFGLIGSAGSLSTDVMQQPNSNGAPADKVTTTAEHLADQMDDQSYAYTQWIGQMEYIVLYDYGKLSAVGNAIGNDPAWTWPTTANAQAVTALQANATASAYAALIPVVWSGYNLTPDFVTQTSSNDVTTLSCAPPYQNHSFTSALSQNQFHALTSIAGNGAAVDQAWTFAEPLNLGVWSLSNFYGTRSATLPNTSLTDYIYGQYATGHEQNGTYSYGAYQNAPQWWRNTYNPPGFVQCNAQGNSLYGYSWAATPAQISPPPP